MIKVYAIDPEAMCNHIIASKLEDFGFEHGRIVADLPSNWGDEVLRIYKSIPRNSKEFEVLIHRFVSKQALIPVPSQNVKSTWLETARNISREYLDGILQLQQRNTETGDDRVIGLADLHDECMVWRSQNGVRIDRKPEVIADAVKVLLRYSSDIKFVDTYFSAESKYFETLLCCLKKLSTFPIARKRRIEIHFTNNRLVKFKRYLKNREQLDSENKRYFLTIGEEVSKKFEGFEIYLVMWDYITANGRFHDRHIVTERGAIDFAGGLDMGLQNTKTTVTRMCREAHDELKNIYRTDGKYFDLLHVGITRKNSTSFECLNSSSWTP